MGKFKAIMRGMFPTFNSYLNFMMMVFLTIVIIVLMDRPCNLTDRLITGFAMLYCYNEWAQALPKRAK